MTLLFPLFLIASTITVPAFGELARSRSIPRKLSKKKKCTHVVFPPTSTCDPSTQIGPLAIPVFSFTDVVITKDLFLNDEAIVNAQFLKIDTNGDGFSDGLEGFANFQFRDENRGGAVRAVTVQSGYTNGIISIIVGAAVLNVDYSGDPSNWKFTLFSDDAPDGFVLPLDVASSLINGSPNGSGLGDEVQFLLFKGFDLFVKYAFGFLFEEEKRRNLLAFGDGAGQRNLDSFAECSAWGKFWYIARIVAGCLVGGIVAVTTCLISLTATGATFGVAFATIVIGCIGVPTAVVGACSTAIEGFCL